MGGSGTHRHYKKDSAPTGFVRSYFCARKRVSANLTACRDSTHNINNVSKGGKTTHGFLAVLATTESGEAEVAFA